MVFTGDEAFASKLKILCVAEWPLCQYRLVGFYRGGGGRTVPKCVRVRFKFNRVVAGR